MKRLATLAYYGFAWSLPMQPFPGYRFGYMLRAWLLRAMGASCGDRIVVKNKCYIGNGEGLRIGNRSQLSSHGHIGKYVTIGDDVVMGPEVNIMTSAHAFENVSIPINRQGFTPIAPVMIGNDVWLGTRVIVMPGVSIGDGCVIGAGAVVTRSLPPYSVAVGIPAKVIRLRGSRLPGRNDG